MSINNYIKLLRQEVPPVELGNKNKTGKCGMCGTRSKKLYEQKCGSVDFMICENCKKEFDVVYGSGRFCCSKCARGFSTKDKRKEINEKVRSTLSGLCQTYRLYM